MKQDADDSASSSIECVLEPQGLSRRGFIKSTAIGALAGAATLSGIGCASSPQAMPKSENFLLKGGVVLTMDSKVGDFEKADVLIRGSKIADVRENIAAENGMEVVDVSNRIVMPGFVDTHHHNYQRVLINQMSNALLSDYARDIYSELGVNQYFRPEDAYIGQKLAGLSAINHGITTVTDLSSAPHTAEINDASLKGLRESGVRAVFCQGRGEFEQLKERHFNNDENLITLAFDTYTVEEDIRYARSVGVPIVSHVVSAFDPTVPEKIVSLGKKGLLGPDLTFIHCTGLTDAAWGEIAKNNVNVSIATPIEMMMRHGEPPIQKALDMEVPFSLSSDVDCTMTQSPFLMMRSTLSLQRMLVHQRALKGEQNLPDLLTTKKILEIATLNGSKSHGLADKVGSLTPGKEADIILLSTDAINVMPMNNAYGAVVTTMDSSNVDSVFIAGRPRKWQGAMVDVNLDHVSALAKSSRNYLFSKTGWSRSVLDTSHSGT